MAAEGHTRSVFRDIWAQMERKVRDILYLVTARDVPYVQRCRASPNRKLNMDISNEPVMCTSSQYFTRWDNSDECQKATIGDVIAQFAGEPDPTAKSSRQMMCLSGHFDGPRGKAGKLPGETPSKSPTRWSCLVPIDYDLKDGKIPKSAVKAIRSLPWIAGAWRSYSGRGFHAIAAVSPRPASGKQYREAANTVIDSLFDILPELSLIHI